MVKKLLIITVIVIAGLLLILYLMQTNASWAGVSDEVTDLTLMRCRPYLPSKLAVKQTALPDGTDINATQQLGNPWQKTSNVTQTVLTTLGECFRAAKIDEASLEQTRKTMDQELQPLYGRIQTAKNYYTSLPAPTDPNYRRNIFE